MIPFALRVQHPHIPCVQRIVMRDGEYIDEDQVWEWYVQIVMALRYVHTW